MSSDRAAPFSIKSGAQLPFSTLSAFSRSLLEHKKKIFNRSKIFSIYKNSYAKWKTLVLVGRRLGNCRIGEVRELDSIYLSSSNTLCESDHSNFCISACALVYLYVSFFGCRHASLTQSSSLLRDHLIFFSPVALILASFRSPTMHA